MDNQMVIDKDNQEMFEVFCRLHPIEAYHLNPEKFCSYVRQEFPPMTDKDIEELIKECEEDEQKVDIR